jgi:hypothetical protein
VTQGVVKAEPNPIYTVAQALRQQAYKEPRFLYLAWLNFYKYIHYKYIVRDEARAKNYVEFFEKGTGEVIDRLNEGHDDAIEAGVLTYFVLKMQRLGYAHKVEEALRKVFDMCAEHLNEHTIEKCPIQSRCLGLSHILLPVHENENVENRRRMCLSGDAKEIADYCTYAHFSIALNTLLISDAKEKEGMATDVIKWASRVARDYYKNLYPYFIALSMVSLGLVATATNRREEGVARRLFRRLSTKLSKERTIMSIRRHVWVIIILALELNNLKEIKYVPENYIVVDKTMLNSIVNKMNAFSSEIIHKTLWIPMTTLIVLTGIPYIFQLIAQFIPQMQQYATTISNTFCTVLAPLVLVVAIALQHIVQHIAKGIVERYKREVEAILNEMINNV